MAHVPGRLPHTQRGAGTGVFKQVSYGTSTSAAEFERVHIIYFFCFVCHSVRSACPKFERSGPDARRLVARFARAS